MATLVTDPFVEQQLRAQRAEWNIDCFDEVWDGVYMIVPPRNVEHQGLVTKLSSVGWQLLKSPGLGHSYPGVCVSDRDEGWEQNYRFPDVVLALNGGRAKDCGTHYCGGPDFIIEIVSPDDHSREKLPFYGAIGVRELMMVDRDPWSLELYQLHDGELRLAGESRSDEPVVLPSAVVPLSFRLVPGKARPQIEVTRRDGVQRWII